METTNKLYDYALQYYYCFFVEKFWNIKIVLEKLI
jgi:hypothetical protein